MPCSRRRGFPNDMSIANSRTTSLKGRNCNSPPPACRFVEEYPVDKTGLLLVGTIGTGKTHLAVGIAKALIREKGIP